MTTRTCDYVRCQTRSKLEDHREYILANCEGLVGALSNVNQYRNEGLLKVANKMYYLPDLHHNLLLRILRLADGYHIRGISTSPKEKCAETSNKTIFETIKAGRFVHPRNLAEIKPSFGG